jgi:hypothetical protein
MTPSAYMTDKAWLKVAPHLCKGLRALPVVRDHPDWYMFVTLDGYSSHLQDKALAIFTEYRILLVQEDGDTSQINQAYDQEVAKSDKRMVYRLLDKHRVLSKTKVNQWSLIVVCAQVLSTVNKSAWVSSFIKVNLHPDHRVDFTEWLLKIDSAITTGEQFFKGRTSFYDAMPAFWRNMAVTTRRQLIERIDKFYTEATQEKGHGTVTMSLTLLHMCPSKTYQGFVHAT